jgi:hypothetical protein
MGWQYRVFKETITEGEFSDTNYSFREVVSDNPACEVGEVLSFTGEKSVSSDTAGIWTLCKRPLNYLL